MRNNHYIIFLSAMLILVVMAIAFALKKSYGYVRSLIAGNELLAGNIRITELNEQILMPILQFEGRMSQPIMEGDTIHFGGMNTNRQKIEAASEELKMLVKTISGQSLFEQLDTLILAELQFEDNLLKALSTEGLLSAKKMYQHEQGTGRVRQIIQVADLLGNTEKISLSDARLNWTGIAGSLRRWEFVMAIIAIGLSLFTFVFTIKQIKLRQQLMARHEECIGKAHEASTARENFMANMSHEIRTPTNAIIGFTQLLQQERITEKSVGYVRCIEHAGKNLLSIINDVLDFSKIDAGMLRIESKPFNIRDLMESVKMMSDESVRKKNLEFILEVDDSVPETVKGDAFRLTQIITNLVNNAIKFTDEGFVSVKLVADQSKTGTVDISFAVKDSGIGIPPDKIHKVFERFQQVDDDVARKYGGTGLGLSIVRQLVELQKGEISVSTSQSGGTGFIFTIPFKSSDDDGEKITGTITDTESTLPGSTRARILIADDNQMNQEFLGYLLRRWSFDFKIVANGFEAVEALRADHFDLVLMDIQMPGMDGYTATAKIRNDLRSFVPVIGMTARALTGERERCLSSGMNEYISKPLQVKALQEVIRNYLRVQPQAHNDWCIQSDVPKEPFNLAYLKELSAGDTSFEKKMIQEFLTQVPVLLDELQKASEQREYKKAAAIAHNLKTSVAFLGLSDSLEEQLSFIEYQAAGATLSLPLREKVEIVKEICQRAVFKAREYLSLVPGPDYGYSSGLAN